MVSKAVRKEIDRVITETWEKNISEDYVNDYALREDSLKSCFYYHLRRKLATILRENDLRIYTEFHFQGLGYWADLAIVQIDPEHEGKHLKEAVTEVVAVIELKYDGGNSQRAADWIASDIPKLKNYIQSGVEGHFYFAAIYETECESLEWFTKKQTNNWAAGRVTELDAGMINGEWVFMPHAY